MILNINSDKFDGNFGSKTLKDLMTYFQLNNPFWYFTSSSISE